MVSDKVGSSLVTSLDVGERLFGFPGPGCGVNDIAVLFPALVAIAAQDMPNRVWGNFYPLPAKVNSESASAKAGFLTKSLPVFGGGNDVGDGICLLALLLFGPGIIT
jgi:hypothetical protein